MSARATRQEPSIPGGSLGIAFVVCVLSAGSSLSAPIASLSEPLADQCSRLAGMPVESGIVLSAQHLQKGASLGWSWFGSSEAQASFCLARLRLQPTSSSDINVVVWLPDDWNGKLFGYGGGGFTGGLGQSDEVMNAGAARGYAGVTSDLGHPTGLTAKWAGGQPEKVIDFGHRANHLAAVTAKQLINAYYGKPAAHAFFQGCSGGGREALMEVSRYPGDYDGVIAGSPAMNYGDIMTRLIWSKNTLAETRFLRFKLSTLRKSILKACDTLDGVQDGVLENPPKCSFDPGVLQCEGSGSLSCLTKSEVDVLRKVYDGPRLASGERVISGPALGGEALFGMFGGFFSNVGGRQYYRWMVHDDPDWSDDDFDLDRDYAASSSRIQPVVDSGNPDISAFAARGGKLILYHGWSDPLIPGANTVRYYEAVLAQLGTQADSSVRLFMVPGMEHCGGGPGATAFDMIPHLEAWVERGEAPERVIAFARESDSPFSRRLCAWPRTAHYNGSGSSRDAANFSCQSPQ